jgi:hypothetical protein
LVREAVRQSSPGPRCSAAGEALLVEFDDGELLTIRAPEGVTVDADVFRVKDAQLVRRE